VVGRRVGADEQFRYSEGMKEFGGRWTRERLDRFLEDPAGTVPGNTMQFDGIKDPEQRRRLIEFLEELS
jgi:cytochrome c2